MWTERADPSQLRKHIRTKRLEEVRQLGMDRVVVFTFGAGNVQCHLIMELYAAVRCTARHAVKHDCGCD